ncbi:esterase [Sphingorhabdus lutea]|uniref:Esterase n=1 Tax=Sphingorhabdus lutea TaxID=1913578 RepID=A0A1L3JAJ1_9SPHN|nr:polyhydroxyalkanoate depolymerase [Sphingorhabdus lutea]APG62141.1 esterase [Sphingorhabdus lutea]
MLYTLHEMQKNWLASVSYMAQLQANLLNNPSNPFAYLGGGPVVASALDVFAHSAMTRGKPDFGITETMIDDKNIAIDEQIEARKPFGQLKHFVKSGIKDAPKLLIVAPMSGHYATLLRGTVARMLPGHDVWITDWRDARNVPLSDGIFDLDDYIDYLVDWLAHIGPGAHMLAVCQPSVPCYAAAALMSKRGDPNRPKSLTMMGGPIDTREAPTAVNKLAMERPFSWFQQNVIATVPAHYAGRGRKVYPGFLQLAGFMSMNLGNHMMSHWEMFKHLIEGNDDGADATKAFYDEYRSVCDMTAEFYLQTIDLVFQNHALPKGEYMHRGELINAADITDIALMAVEGEKDDISGIGQTKAALTIATHLPDNMKQYYMAKDAGHYGIFNGSKWRDKVAPRVIDWIAKHN